MSGKLLNCLAQFYFKSEVGALLQYITLAVLQYNRKSSCNSAKEIGFPHFFAVNNVLQAV
jgi:hypothetical protein